MKAINNINLEERITCGKIKSKAKTLLMGKNNKNLISNKDMENMLIIPTIKINKIIINYANSTDYDKICSYLLNSTIVVSNSSNPKDSNLISTQINNICIYPYVSNKLICMNDNFKLKFIDGKLNKTFNENEKITINKFSNNIDALNDAMNNYMCKINVKQSQLKKDVNEHFDNIENNVYREFIVRYIG